MTITTHLSKSNGMNFLISLFFLTFANTTIMKELLTSRNA